MFTGIVEETGVVIAINSKNDGKRISIRAQNVLADLKNGDSIAVNGVCLTVEEKNNDNFTIFAVPETLGLTNIGFLAINDCVNLERALKVSDRLGGHIVQGHVEAMADVINVEKFENHWDVSIRYSSAYVIPKGSIAVDGISLTVHAISKDFIQFQIIPETIKKTNILQWKADTKVNIETDYLVKAMDSIVRWRAENT
ncbi:MAG: riboflavin synthase [Spirochaetia bacterium]|nr:riboflavin synthase [Spirochaetia bacterium]